MALESINPSGTQAWQNLRKHFEDMQYVSMQELFQKEDKGNLPVAIIQNGTTAEEKMGVGTVDSILEVVKANRQRLQTAKAEWESENSKSVSRDTFRRFLKALADDTKE